MTIGYFADFIEELVDGAAAEADRPKHPQLSDGIHLRTTGDSLIYKALEPISLAFAREDCEYVQKVIQTQCHIHLQAMKDNPYPCPRHFQHSQ